MPPSSHTVASSGLLFSISAYYSLSLLGISILLFYCFFPSTVENKLYGYKGHFCLFTTPLDQGLGQTPVFIGAQKIYCGRINKWVQIGRGRDSVYIYFLFFHIQSWQFSNISNSLTSTESNVNILLYLISRQCDLEVQRRKRAIMNLTESVCICK